MTAGLVVAVLASSIVTQITGQLPGNVAELVGALPNPTTPAGVLFYAAWGVFGVAGAKKLVGRMRSGKGPAPTVNQEASQVNTGATTVGSESGGGANGHGKSGFGQSVAFTLPGFLPVSKGIREVTTNEVHALELGAIVGFVAVWLIHIGRRDAGFGLALVFVGGSLGYKRYKSKAFKTIRMEPWYALMAFAAGGIVAALVFDPALVTQFL
ncbi:hypothetical protein [Halorientalis pallida]|uniref:Uncharacterized protein n=1 Tax=Halorientalis pallida TaxID=2479928 RepID=A0A498KVU9_9EURY|nr:hypothetical protein [Halorientalis pallida]RXK48648.1 hypothetical protein EAF64_13320 [Halorientalis pallida]